MNNGIKYLCFAFALLILFASVPAAVAQSLDWVPQLRVNGGYNDNILFTSTEPVKDFYTSVRPEIDMGLASDRYDLQLRSYAEITRYLEEMDLDTENYRGEMDGRYRLSPRLDISGGLLYVKDTTLDSELEETGRLVARNDRDLYQGDAAMAFGLDEVSEMDVEYQYRSIDYTSGDSIDRISHRLRIPYKRWFNDRLDQVTLRPSYTRTETEDDRNIDYYSVSFGWMHTFSRTLRMRNFVGYGYYITTRDGSQDLYRTTSADLSLTRTDENTSFTLGARSDIDLDADGTLEEVDKLYCRIRKKITERLSAAFNGAVYLNRQPETYDYTDSVYYDVKPELSYEITENYFLNLFYRYSYEEDRTVSEDQESVRNVVEFTLGFRFPMQE